MPRFRSDRTAKTSLRRRAETAARTPYYAVLVTVLLAITGLLGSVYSAEIKAAFPFYLGRPTRFVASAAAFWAVLVLTAFVFGVRQWAIDCARQRGERRLHRTTRELVRAIRTMPPVDFLARFGDIYRECEDATWRAREGSPEPTREQLVRSIRRVLRGFAALARHFDGSDEDQLYAANIMVFIRSECISPEKARVVKGRMKLCEPEIAVEDLYGILDLRRELSACAGQSSDEDWDQSLVPLALAIPRDVLVEVSDGPGAWRIMPGAPIAFVLKEADSYTDTTELGQWCKQWGDFTATVRQQVQDYFDPATAPPVRSFISLPLVWGEGEDEDAEEVPIAVLNIHRDEPDLLKEDGEPVRHFVAVTRPLRLLLMRLLTDLQRHESKEGDTWEVIVDQAGGPPKPPVVELPLSTTGNESGTVIEGASPP